MLTIRKSQERGHAHHGWLESYHTFSFADYYDPEYMGVSHLRVINEDYIQPSRGFPTHGHRDMEIITYILAGALEHKDSMGNTSVIHPGEVQRMSAGSGVTHSEYNASQTEPVHLLQIWILPQQIGLSPSYEQKNFPLEEKRGMFRLLASQDGRQGSVTIHQDTQLYATVLDTGEQAHYALAAERGAYLHIARGHAKVNGAFVQAGDGVLLRDEPHVQVEGVINTELLLFDLLYKVH